jgi:hypothetical protein
MTPYHQFVSLLYEACFASEAVDHFDHRSDQGAAHQAAWAWLLGQQHAALQALVRHVERHAAVILADLGEPPEAPAEPPAKLLRNADMVTARFAFVSRYAIEAERAARAIDQ